MDIFKAIGDRLETFLDANEQFKPKTSLTPACILMELDLSEGLAEDVDLIMGNTSSIQSFDYIGIPFFFMSIAIFLVSWVVSVSLSSITRSGGRDLAATLDKRQRIRLLFLREMMVI
jgi:hypothetical protein